MAQTTFPITVGHCLVDASIMGTAQPLHFDVVSRRDALDIVTYPGKSPETMTISNDGVASYVPPRTHNTRLSAPELQRWGNALRDCAAGLETPIQRNSFRELGAKLDAIAKSRGR